jgi:hypothetical protein
LFALVLAIGIVVDNAIGLAAAVQVDADGDLGFEGIAGDFGLPHGALGRG